MIFIVMKNDKLVQEFLSKNYPPKRVRVRHGFKQAYIIGNITYFTANKEDMLALALNLNKIIELVFCSEKNSHSEMINKFLRIL